MQLVTEVDYESDSITPWNLRAKGPSSNVPLVKKVMESASTYSSIWETGNLEKTDDIMVEDMTEVCSCRSSFAETQSSISLSSCFQDSTNGSLRGACPSQISRQALRWANVTIFCMKLWTGTRLADLLRQNEICVQCKHDLYLQAPQAEIQHIFLQ